MTAQNTPGFFIHRNLALPALNRRLSMTAISRLLGNGSTDITEKVYAKFLPRILTVEVERLGYAYLPEEL
ncbi:MAG: hypothetical protein NC421_09665 [Lachnospiraceae bacterium]|nr:hypothetical protein [Lachnospiraceae bacterium]